MADVSMFNILVMTKEELWGLDKNLKRGQSKIHPNVSETSSSLSRLALMSGCRC